MRLLSCDDCGSVFDLNKIITPEEVHVDDRDPNDWHWDGDGFIPIFTCPVCKGKTPIENA